MSMRILDLLTHKVVVRTKSSSSVYVYMIMCMEALCKLLGSMIGPSQDLEGMPETTDSTEPYIYCVFFICVYIPMIKFNL